MNNPLQDIDKAFEQDLPERETMEQYLDMMLPSIRHLSEDLSETKFYMGNGGKPWMEVKEDPDFQEIVLHFFNSNNEYLKVVNGNVYRGRWRLLDQTNKLILEQGGGGKSGDASRSELFELAFLNAHFFILKKHGVQSGKGLKYFFMGYEGTVKSLSWKDCMELLFNEFRNVWKPFNTIVAVAVIIIVIFLLISYY